VHSGSTIVSPGPMDGVRVFEEHVERAGLALGVLPVVADAGEDFAGPGQWRPQPHRIQRDRQGASRQPLEGGTQRLETSMICSIRCWGEWPPTPPWQTRRPPPLRRSARRDADTRPAPWSSKSTSRIESLPLLDVLACGAAGYRRTGARRSVAAHASQGRSRAKLCLTNIVSHEIVKYFCQHTVS
jgi:hypothetical protein